MVLKKLILICFCNYLIIKEILTIDLNESTELNIFNSSAKIIVKTTEVENRPEQFNESNKIASQNRGCCIHDHSNLNVDLRNEEVKQFYKFKYQIIVYFETKNGTIQNIESRTIPSTFSSTTFTNKSCNKSYKILVYVLRKNSKYEVLRTKCVKTPLPPSSLFVDEQSLTSYSFDIRWLPPSNFTEFDGYEIRIDNLSRPKWVSKDSELVVNFAEDIKPGQTYNLIIMTKSNNLVSGQKTLPVTTKPLSVINIKAEPRKLSSIFLFWQTDLSSTQDSYRIFYKINGHNHSIIKNTTDKFILLPGLDTGYNYCINIQAISNNILSNASIVYQATYPTKPIFGDFDIVSERSLDISWRWDDQLMLDTFFKIIWIRIDNKISDEMTITRNHYTAHISNLYPGAQYTFMICVNSNGLFSDTGYKNYTMRPLPPTNLVFLNDTYSNKFVSWHKPLNSLVDYYIIKVKSSNGIDLPDIKPVYETMYNIDPLDEKKIYVVDVVSYSNGRESYKSGQMIRSNFPMLIYKDDSTKSPETKPRNKHENFGDILVIIILILTGIFVVSAIGYQLIKIYLRKITIPILCENLPMVEITKENMLRNDPEKYALLSNFDDNHKIKSIYIHMLDKLGNGNFGDVYLASLKSASTVQSRNDYDLNEFLKEARIMMNFKHVNVLNLIGVSLDSSGAPLVVLPYMEKGDLLKYLKNDQNHPTVKQLLQFSLNVAEGMDYLARQGYVHRDLAARNCLLDNDLRVKVADFGLTRAINDKEYYRIINNKQRLPIRWMSYESIAHGIFTTKSDVWSFGILMWEILTRGKLPYSSFENYEIRKLLKSGYRLEKADYCPQLIYEMQRLCWAIDTNNRPTFEQIAQRLDEILSDNDILKNPNNIYYNRQII